MAEQDNDPFKEFGGQAIGNNKSTSTPVVQDETDPFAEFGGKSLKKKLQSVKSPTTSQSSKTSFGANSFGDSFLSNKQKQEVYNQLEKSDAKKPQNTDVKTNRQTVVDDSPKPDFYGDVVDFLSAPIQESARVLTNTLQYGADAIFGSPKETMQQRIDKANVNEENSPKRQFDAEYLKKVSENIGANKFADNIEKSGEPNAKKIAEGIRERNKQWFSLPVDERKAIREFDNQQEREANINNLESFENEQKKVSEEIRTEKEKLYLPPTGVDSNSSFNKLNSLYSRLDEIAVKKATLELKPQIFKSQIFKDDKEVLNNLGNEMEEVLSRIRDNDPSSYERLYKQFNSSWSNVSSKEKKNLISEALKIKQRNLSEAVSESNENGELEMVKSYGEEVKKFNNAVQSGDNNTALKQQQLLQSYKESGIDNVIGKLNLFSEQENEIKDFLKSSSVKYELFDDEKKQKEVEKFVEDNPILGRAWELTKSVYGILPKTIKTGIGIGEAIGNTLSGDSEASRKNVGIQKFKEVVDMVSPTQAKLKILKGDGDIDWKNLVNFTGDQVATMTVLLQGGSTMTGVLKGVGLPSKIAQGVGLMASSFAISKDQYYDKAVSMGMKSKDATLFANQSAGLTSLLELISPNDMIVTGKIKSEITKDFAKYFTNGGLKYALGQSAKRIAKETFGKELPQEISQLLGDKFLELAYNRTSDTRFNENIDHKELKETVIGTIAATSVLTAARNKQINNQEKQQYLYEASKDLNALQETIKGMNLSKNDMDSIMEQIIPYNKAHSSMPEDLDEEIKKNVAPLLVAKDKLAQQANLENLDPSFKTAINERVKIIDNAIVGMVNGKFDPSKLVISDDPKEAIKNTEDNINNGTNKVEEKGLEEGKQNLDAFKEEKNYTDKKQTNEIFKEYDENLDNEGMLPMADAKLEQIRENLSKEFGVERYDDIFDRLKKESNKGKGFFAKLKANDLQIREQTEKEFRKNVEDAIAKTKPSNEVVSKTEATTPTEEVKAVKETETAPIKEIYDTNKEVNKVGNEKEYSEYTNSIFPDSKVKDVVYHGTNEKFETFEKGKGNPTTKTNTVGFHFIDGASKEDYKDVYGEMMPVKIDFKKPLRVEYDTEDGSMAQRLEYLTEDDVADFRKQGYDGGIITRGNETEYVAFSPEQIQILGSKNDIEGFKSYKNENKQSVPESKNVETVEAPVEEEAKQVDEAKQFAVDEINKGSINWDGDMLTPRPELDMDWRDIRKGKADLLAGKDTEMGRRLTASINKAKADGGYNFVQGSGKLTNKIFVPINGDVKQTTDLTKDELKYVAENETTLANEYDEWFNNLSEEEKSEELNSIENGNANKINTEPKGTKNVRNQEDAGASEKTDEKVKAGDPIRAFADKVRSGKINKLGGFKTSTGFDGAWDLGLETVVLTLDGGTKVADAIQAGLETIKKTDWYKNLSDKKDFDDKYNAHMNAEYETESETKTEPKAEPKKENNFTAKLKESIEGETLANSMNNLNREAWTSPTAEEQAYFEADMREAFKHGIDIVETAKKEFGDEYVEKMLDYIANNKINYDSESLAIISLENDLEYRITQEPDNAPKLENQLRKVRKVSTEMQRQKARGLGFGRLRQIGRVGWEVAKVTEDFFSTKDSSTRKKIKKVVEDDGDAINKQADEEAQAEAEGNIIEFTKDELYKKPTTKAIAKSLADKIRKLKSGQKLNQLSSTDIIGVVNYFRDGAIEAVALTVEGGGTVIEGIAKATKFIQNEQRKRKEKISSTRELTKAIKETIFEVKTTIKSEAQKRSEYLTRLNNDIEELDIQIENKEKTVVDKQDKYKNDEEIKSLREVRESKLEELNQIDPTAKEAAKLRSDLNKAQKSLEEYERRINEVDFTLAEKQSGKVKEELQNLRDKRDKVREDYLSKKKAYEESLKKPLSEDEIAQNEVEKKIAYTERSIADLKEKLANNDLSTNSKQSSLWTQEIGELESEKVKLQKELNERRNGAKENSQPKEPPTAQELLDKAKNNLRERIEEKKQQIADKKVELEARSVKFEKDTEYKDLNRELKYLNEQAQQFLTPNSQAIIDERKKNAMVTKLENELSDLDEQIANQTKKAKESKSNPLSSPVINDLKARKKVKQELLNDIDPDIKDVVKNALIDAGYSREITVNTKDGKEKRTVLDWKQISNAQDISDVVDKSLKSIVEKSLDGKGYSKVQIDRMKVAIQNELTRLRTDVIAKKSDIELDRKNTPNDNVGARRTAKRLAEAYNLGLFDKNPDTYNYLINSMLGMRLDDQKLFFEANKIAGLMSNVYKMIDPATGEKYTEFGVSEVINQLDNMLSSVLTKSVKSNASKAGAGGKAFNFFTLTQAFIGGNMRNKLTSIRNVAENALSSNTEINIGKMQDFFSNGFKGGKYMTMEQRKSIAQDARKLFEDTVFNAGGEYGGTGNPFVSKNVIEDAINDWIDKKDYKKLHSVFSGMSMRAGLSGIDSYVKIRLTEAQFSRNMIKVLTSESNPNKMSKEDALAYVSEKTTGQSKADAMIKASTIIEEINKSAGKEMLKNNPENVNRIANNLIKDALVLGSEISPEMIKASFNAAYKSAGRGIGHEANNVGTQTLTWVNQGFERKLKESIKNEDWGTAAAIQGTQIIYKNVINPFVGGGLNWTVLGLQKSGVPIHYLLDPFNAWKGQKAIDVSSKEGIKELEKTLTDNANQNRDNARTLMGAVFSASILSGLALGTDDDDRDKFRKYLKEHPFLEKAFTKLAPPSVVGYMAYGDKEGKLLTYIRTLLNQRAELYSDKEMLFKSISGNLPKGNNASGVVGDIVGDYIGVPFLPNPFFKDIKDAKRDFQGVKETDSEKKKRYQTYGFLNGYFKNGWVDIAGQRPFDKDIDTKLTAKERAQKRKERREKRDRD